MRNHIVRNVLLTVVLCPPIIRETVSAYLFPTRRNLKQRATDIVQSDSNGCKMNHWKHNINI